jgi:phosphate-selective porin OprO/OprP
VSSHSLKLLAAASLAALIAGQAQAQAEPNDKQIRDLQRQINTLQKQMNGLKAKPATVHKAAEKAESTATLKMPKNKPTFCTADGDNCVSLTGRAHLDFGGYSYKPNSALTSPQDMRNGFNARRARIGLTGTFARYWDWGVVIDGGGSQDGQATLNNAYIAYKGVKGLVVEGGYMDVPYTLDETISSNNIMFMERATSQVLATDIAAGDNRAAFGARAFDKWWWTGLYVTGPTTGYNHSTRVPVGMTGRLVVVPINNDFGSLLIGGDFQYLFDTGGAPNVNELRLRDRPEIRIDPNRILDTGTLTNIKSARVLSGEVAGGIGSFYFQGEYFNYAISRDGLTDLTFNGGYAQASYMLTGEKRKYNTSAGSYGGISPKNPFTPHGGIGAWELAARYSYVDLNDSVVYGGVQKNLTFGVNWYVNDNLRFMLNWVNGEVEKRNAANIDVGAKYNAVAMRAQVAF